MTQYIPEVAHAVTTDTGDQFNANSAQLPGGGHVVVWNSGDAGTPTSLRAFAQVYDAQGNAVGGPFQLFTDPLFATEGARIGGVTALPDGSFVVLAASEHVYTNFPADWNFYQERVSATGQVLNGPSFVATYNSNDYPFAVPGAAFTAPDGASYYVSIDSKVQPRPYFFNGTDLYHFDVNGNPAGEKVAAGGMDFKLPDAAVLAGGNVITVDEFGLMTNDVQINAFDASGNQLAQTDIGGTDYFQGLGNRVPDVAALGDGNALVVWYRFDANGGSQWRAQAVDAMGNLLGNSQELSVPASVQEVHLTSLATGGVLAWWDSGSGWLAQALDAQGNAASDAFVISPSTPSITATADGGFLVEYTQEHSGTQEDVVEQKFDAVPDSSGGPTPTDGVLTLTGTHTQYTVASNSISGPDGTISLAGVERVHFADNFALAFDVNGDAGEAYRLYQAAFDRAPDLPGLGYHINDLDHGVPLWLVAQHFIDSPEFQTTYGNTDNTQFITLLYQNVLHRAPDTGGLQFHLDEFAHGESRADMLIHFSESPENQANVIGQIDNGMLYVPIS